MFVPYSALWRCDVPGAGLAYRLVIVMSPPEFGHVKCHGSPVAGRSVWKLPVEEIIGLPGDGYAVVVAK